MRINNTKYRVIVNITKNKTYDVHSNKILLVQLFLSKDSALIAKV